MYKTTKSPRKVLLVAHAVAVESLPAYSHLYSPKKFTQHQLFSVLVLKEFMRCDYRKVVELLNETPDYREAIGLKSVPHFTTIQKASRRLLKLPSARSLLESTVKMGFKKNS
jgi:hypothetical protein